MVDLTPTIQVIAVPRDGADTIRDCVIRVKNESYPCERLIIDSSSSDETANLSQECGLQGIALVSEADKGLYDAINKGITLPGGTSQVLHLDCSPACFV